MENEVLDEENGKVAALLSALPRADAPENFEFGVKAKIASGRRPSGVFTFLKVAAPVSLLMLSGVFAVYFYPSGEKIVVQEPAPAGTQGFPASSDTRQAGPVAPAPSPAVIEHPPVVEVNDPNVDRERRTARRPVGNSLDQRLTRQEALKAANVINPPGFQSTPIAGQNSNSAPAPNVSVREVLDVLGVRADFVDGAWTVQSITDNSIAARSGVRPKDVVQSLDDQPLTEKSTLKSGSQTITIRREGKQIKLDLKN